MSRSAGLAALAATALGGVLVAACSDGSGNPLVEPGKDSGPPDAPTVYHPQPYDGGGADVTPIPPGHECFGGALSCDPSKPDACETDPVNDVHHCGICARDCTKLPNVAGDTRCEESHCVLSQDSCAPGFAHCGKTLNTGCETDLSADDNCGSCGHDCGGGKCVDAKAGICSAAPFVKATGATALGIDGAGIFYGKGDATNGYSIYGINKPNSVTAVMFKAAGKPIAIVSDNDNVYEADDSGAILRWSKNDNTVTKLHTDAQHPAHSLAVAGGRVYFATQGAIVGSMKSTDGGDLQLSPAHAGTAQEIVADANGAFFTDAAGPVSTFAGSALWSGAHATLGIGIDDKNVYFGEVDAAAHGLWRMARDGSAPVQLDSAHTPDGVVVSDKKIYYTDRAGGAVYSIAVDAAAGTAPTTLATGQDQPGTIVADGKAIYWLNEKTGDLMRIIK